MAFTIAIPAPEVCLPLQMHIFAYVYDPKTTNLQLLVLPITLAILSLLLPLLLLLLLLIRVPLLLLLVQYYQILQLVTLTSV